MTTTGSQQTTPPTAIPHNLLPHPRRLIEIGPHRAAHWVALRAGIAVAVPLLVLHVTGHIELSLFAVFGAFTALYGRAHTHITRARMQATAGAGLILSIVLGTTLSALDAGDWLVLAIVAAVAAAATFVSDALDWHPPGALFFVFALAACATVPARPSDIPVALVVATASAAFAMLVSTVGLVAPRSRSRESTRLAISFRAAAAQRGESTKVVGIGIAVFVAGAIPIAAGLGHPYWAMVSAVAALGAADTAGHLVRAGHRVAGTLIGVAVAALLLAVNPGPLTLILFVVVLQMGAELFVMRNYGIAMIFVTPLALLMTQLAHPLDEATLFRDRALETILGAAVGIAVSLAIGTLSRKVHAKSYGPSRL